MRPQFHPLTVSRVTPEAGGAVVLSLAVPPALRASFAFRPGQFLTLRASIAGQDLRRSYSICSTPHRLAATGELEVGIRTVPGGVFSNWAASSLQAGAGLQVMPPDGRFCIQNTAARHRVGFAAGSGITPILSLMASSLADSPQARFSLVYGNKTTASVMFGEALQDLKDRYPERLTLIHILSRQAQEVPLLHGRIDAAKVSALTAQLLPVASMDEVFICGPEAMIEATQAALLAAGLPANRVHSERFASGHGAPSAVSTPSENSAPNTSNATNSIANNRLSTWTIAPNGSNSVPAEPATALLIQLDGKTHSLQMSAQDKVLDVALAAGLDLPYACKGGVCCTCRAKIMEGQVKMEKNFTLEPWEIAKGFVLTCQARPLTERVVVSFDER